MSIRCAFGIPNYFVLKSRLGTCGIHDILFNVNRSCVEGVSVLEECFRCGKQRAYFVEMNNVKHKISVLFAKTYLGIKKG